MAFKNASARFRSYDKNAPLLCQLCLQCRHNCTKISDCEILRAIKAPFSLKTNPFLTANPSQNNCLFHANSQTVGEIKAVKTFSFSNSHFQSAKKLIYLSFILKLRLSYTDLPFCTSKHTLNFQVGLRYKIKSEFHISSMILQSSPLIVNLHIYF